MIYFSYNDFMDNQEKGKRIRRIEEEISEYEQKSGKFTESITKYPITEILSDKNELTDFLTDFFNITSIIEDPNIVYCRKIKANTDKNSKNIIICKIKGKEIFLIIKEIDKIDTNIAYKMFEHSSNIINRWKKESKEQKIRNPIVIPIVIYTGNSIWKTNNCKENGKINYVTYKDNIINFSYNMLNINDIGEQELKNMNSKVSLIILDIKNKYLQIN